MQLQFCNFRGGQSVLEWRARTLRHRNKEKILFFNAYYTYLPIGVHSWRPQVPTALLPSRLRHRRGPQLVYTSA